MVLQRQSQLVERIKQTEQSIFDEWAKAIPLDIHLYTTAHLLEKCDEGRMLRVNFNKKVEQKKNILNSNSRHSHAIDAGWLLF